MKVTNTRKETFGKNYSVITHHYAAKHAEVFGENSKISEYGYPDMGCGIFGDLLSYPDWVKINNAQ